MKQEEVNKIVNEVIRDERNLGQYTRNEIPIEEFIRISFQKGKLEQKKEELFYFQRAYLLIPMYKSKGKFYSIKSCDKLSKWIEKRIKQLQKEIK